MVRRLSIASLALACLTLSCAQTTTVWKSEPPLQESANNQFSVSLEPLRQADTHFSTFRITVRNKTPSDLQIDWNKTQYIHDGRPSGKFAFRGIEPSALKDGTIPLDTVPAGSAFQKEIAPSGLIAFRPLRERAPAGQPGIGAGMIPQGENGVLLVIRQNGRELRQEVSVTITEGRK